MIPASIIERVKKEIDLQALAADYVEIKRSGPSFLCLCPVHNDSRPSCRLYEDHFYCYACGAHGTCIDWVMAKEECSFAVAVEKLCVRAGITVEHKPVSKVALSYAREEAEYCDWWWSTKIDSLSVCISTCLFSDDMDFVEVLGEIRKQVHAMTPVDKFSSFLQHRTAGDREEYGKHLASREIWKKALMDLLAA